MEHACPHCGIQSNTNHPYCSHCARRMVEYVLCPKCCEPISETASSCPYCTSTIPGPREIAAEALELEVRATRYGAFFAGGNVTGLFFPPIIKVQSGRVTVTKWSLLGLRTHQQEIQVSRVASVRYTKGVIWGGLLVETFGGAADDLNERGLQQEDAMLMAEQLKKCLKD